MIVVVPTSVRTVPTIICPLSLQILTPTHLTQPSGRRWWTFSAPATRRRGMAATEPFKHAPGARSQPWRAHFRPGPPLMAPIVGSRRTAALRRALLLSLFLCAHCLKRAAWESSPAPSRPRTVSRRGAGALRSASAQQMQSRSRAASAQQMRSKEVEHRNSGIGTDA